MKLLITQELSKARPWHFPAHFIAEGVDQTRGWFYSLLAVSTLVFDEVDAGIGGQAAAQVADALSVLAGDRQVMVVTHLAQVAARAQHHVVVDKEFVGKDGGESTVARATVVSGPARVDEIARMLSGDADSAAARRHAQELLSGKSRRP